VQRFLRYSEIAIVVVFTVEYLCRVMLAERKLKFIFSFYGLVDLLAILPFYLAFAVDLRTLRLLRFMRLLRMLKFVRYRAAIERFGGALWIAKEELIIFATAILVFLYLAAVGIYYFEHKAQPEIYRTIFDSLWWAVTSLTTVGYGDMYPITTGGRVFSFFVLMLGLGLIGVPAGIVASALSAVRRRDERAESSDE
jgi:voltage-gated potassium channel